MSAKINFLDECASTNKLLLESLDKGESFSNLYTIFTAYQSHGYGQIGNKWESEGGKNLLFSTLLYPDRVKATEQFFISEAIALAVAETLDSEMLDVSVKWPNDIYWKSKKIAGILIENNLSGPYVKESVIGVGLNINQDIFLSSAPNPISMKNITGKEHDIRAILCVILEKFEQLYTMGLNNRAELHKRYISRLFRYNQNAMYTDANGEFLGSISSVEPDGHLHIIDIDGTDRRYAFKEVAYVL